LVFGFWFLVFGFWFLVLGFWLLVLISGFGFWVDLGLREVRILGEVVDNCHQRRQLAWFGVWGLGFRVWGLGFGFWVLGLGFRV